MKAIKTKRLIKTTHYFFDSVIGTVPGGVFKEIHCNLLEGAYGLFHFLYHEADRPKQLDRLVKRMGAIRALARDREQDQRRKCAEEAGNAATLAKSERRAVGTKLDGFVGYAAPLPRGERP